MNLEQYFDQFRENIVGINQTFLSPYWNAAKHSTRIEMKTNGNRTIIEIRLIIPYSTSVGNSNMEAN